jgi:NAD(P)-dependent dehydrogenase (short-subunit alcohol dehydrogenase family)
VATVLITGSNRGIGLELCRQYHARGDDVIATCRSTSTELENLGVRVIDNIDVTQGDDVARLADEIAGVKLDVIVNNAGILRSDTIDSVDFEHMLEQYNSTVSTRSDRCG